MINSSGVHEPSITQVTGGKVLHEEFLQSYYTTDNSCVWLSASLVINSVDPTEGKTTINQLQSDPHDYGWMYLFGTVDIMSLFLKMQHKMSPYGITHINGIQRELYLDYIVNKCNAGLYVDLLRSSCSEISHTVGINAGSRILFDCAEPTELELTMENLSRCCGPNRKIAKTEVIAELCLKNVKVQVK